MSLALPSFYHFTFSRNTHDVRMRLFEISARRAGFDVRVIPCASTEDKPRALAQAIAKLADDAIVCATDAFDVLCTNTPDSVIDAFRASNHDIVVGAERKGYHHFKSSVQMFEAEPSSTPYRFLNGGVFTGYAGALRGMLAEIVGWQFPANVRTQLARASDHFNDQTLFGKYAVLHPDKVTLDREARICWNIADEWDSFAESLAHAADPFVNPVTGHKPAFLHVSHLRKYYPSYLWAARRLGLPINAGTVVLGLFDQHMTGVVHGVDSGSIPPDSETREILTRTFAYRAMKLKQKTTAFLKSARMELGRRRREIFGGGTA